MVSILKEKIYAKLALKDKRILMKFPPITRDFVSKSILIQINFNLVFLGQ